MVSDALLHLHGFTLSARPETPHLLHHGPPGEYIRSPQEIQTELDRWRQRCREFDRNPDVYREAARARGRAAAEAETRRRALDPVDRLRDITALVVYRDTKGWRFAVYANSGVLNGHLEEPSTCAPEAAQEAVINRLHSRTGRRLDAQWRSTPDGWWTAVVVDDA